MASGQTPWKGKRQPQTRAPEHGNLGSALGQRPTEKQIGSVGASLGEVFSQGATPQGNTKIGKLGSVMGQK